MPSKITILPSGRNFTSEGNSTLLEAGLHSGLALDYGCSNGNCGRCLAKIVSGKVRKVRHHDCTISGDKKLSDHVLMCCHTAVSDVTLVAPEARNSREIPKQQVTAKVKNIDIANNNVALLHLKTPRTNRLRFLAGQYVKLGGHNMPYASHAVSSCPCDDMNLHFQIAGTPADNFSDFVFGQLKKGDPVNINGPYGDFVLDDDSKRALVFIAWQTGFAPIRSLIEHAMALDVTPSIHLVWMTPGQKDRYLDNLCRSWKDAFDNFYYEPVDTAGNALTLDTTSTIERLNISPVDMPNYDFYIACNEILSEKFTKTLEGNNLVFYKTNGHQTGRHPI